MTPQLCTCTCGHVSFQLRDAPLFRFVCHCTICQRFNQSDFADIVVYRLGSVSGLPAGAVNFDTYKPPPNVRRGKCAQCQQPALETFEAPLFPRLAMVPASIHEADHALPDPAAHFFYEKRVSDADDALPKYSRYLPSQLAFFKFYVKAKAKNTSFG